MKTKIAGPQLLLQTCDHPAPILGECQKQSTLQNNYQKTRCKSVSSSSAAYHQLLPSYRVAPAASQRLPSPALHRCPSRRKRKEQLSCRQESSPAPQVSAPLPASTYAGHSNAITRESLASGRGTANGNPAFSAVAFLPSFTQEASFLYANAADPSNFAAPPPFYAAIMRRMDTPLRSCSIQ